MKSRCFEIRKQFNSQMQGLNINATVMTSSFLGLVVLLLTAECHAANHQWDMHGEVGVPRDCSTIAFTCNNQRHLTAAWCDECRRRNNLRCLIKFDKSEHGSGIASGCGHHSGGTLFNGGAKKHYKCTLRMNSVRDNEQNRLNTLCTAWGAGDHTVPKGTFLRSFMTVEEMRQYQLQRYNLQANELHGGMFTLMIYTDGSG